MARPTKYNKEMQAKAEEYVSGGFRDNGNVIPSIEGLSSYLGVTRTTLRNWGDSNAEFLTTLGQIERDQKNITLNEGLKGEFNATIAKLVLANHGMHDKQDVKQEGDLIIKLDGKLAGV